MAIFTVHLEVLFPGVDVNEISRIVPCLELVSEMKRQSGVRFQALGIGGV